MKITEKQICEDQILTFKQSHILLNQGLLFLTRSTCVIVDARSHTCKSHDFIPRYDITSATSHLKFERARAERHVTGTRGNSRLKKAKPSSSRRSHRKTYRPAEARIYHSCVELAIFIGKGNHV